MSELLGTLAGLVASLGNVQSAAVLRERLALMAQQIELARAEVADLRSQLAQAQLEAAQAAQGLAAAQQKIEQFQAGTDAHAQRKGWCCDSCGSARLRRIGSRPDPDFPGMGAKLVKLQCLVCDAASEFCLNPGE